MISQDLAADVVSLRMLADHQTQAARFQDGPLRCPEVGNGVPPRPHKCFVSEVRQGPV